MQLGCAIRTPLSIYWVIFSRMPYEREQTRSTITCLNGFRFTLIQRGSAYSLRARCCPTFARSNAAIIGAIGDRAWHGVPVHVALAHRHLHRHNDARNKRLRASWKLRARHRRAKRVERSWALKARARGASRAAEPWLKLREPKLLEPKCA